MGSAASSNVKEIIIDQNDSKWDQYKRGRTNSSSTKTSASSLSKRLLQSALCTLELRNSELVSETNWLKEQIGETDVPLRLHSSKDVKMEVQEAEKRLREELEKCRQELKEQQKTHEDRMVQLTNEFGQKIAILNKELTNEKMINKKLNESKETNEAMVARNGNEEVIEAQSSTRQSSPSQPQATSYIANRRAISSTQPRRSPNSLKNVYTLSESMEPIKVMETPRTPNSVRPATADTMHYDVRSRDNRSQDNAECTDLSGQMRGSSAPMLFKSRSRAHRRERFNESTNQIDDDLRSIYSNNEHADVQQKETTSDDIEAILNATTASLSNPYESGRRFTAVSALRLSSNHDH
ncbi:hypothetical protein Tcan_02602 [Toxocara canis]|uniref:Uncharacterized protein n=1 Tax=Toxocara canis TaxID=6265 RepID=A0A0B2VTL0_TOXCA|nr:hypothetical protein Tcan_02602 [Toxocara canis]